MFTDIVVPKSNEHEFLKTAEKLGFSSIVFLYPRQEECKGSSAIKAISAVTSLKGKAKIRIIDAKGEGRSLIERRDVSVVYGLESSSRNDFVHHRNSGLNQVLCNLAAKNGTLIGFSFKLYLSSRMKHVILGRMMQNVRLCRRYGVHTLMASFADKPSLMRSPQEMISFGNILGFNSGESKKAISHEF